MSTITITFAVRESKSRTSGEAPIQVLLTQNGARASFSTGKAIQPSEWDRDRQRVKGRDAEAAEINNYLDAIRARLYNLEKVLIDRGLGATPQMLRDAYLDKLDCLKDWTLMTLIEVHMAELRGKIGKSIAKRTVKNYEYGARYIRLHSLCYAGTQYISCRHYWWSRWSYCHVCYIQAYRPLDALKSDSPACCWFHNRYSRNQKDEKTLILFRKMSLYIVNIIPRKKVPI